ncbi:MAG: sigma 54-interacting transcriptional regulator, partial [Myxococcales bacterium]|nr:sigma 54-interacting transcriptional regulator [Myxococcales bacterium]
MPEIRTLPSHVTGLPVRKLRVVVERGPDAGASAISDGEHLSIGSAPGNGLVLTDPKVSRYHVELAPVGAQVRVTDQGSTNGTRVGPAMVRGGAVAVSLGTRIELGDTELVLEDGGVVMLELRDTAGGLVGRSPAMRQLMAKVERLAASDVAVLVLGESGTGKELIARALHDLGPRASAPFVTVDCASLSPTLVASELFGHERGAFTGADRTHVGAFERAHGGTLFLDELGELPEPLQAALLG